MKQLDETTQKQLEGEREKSKAGFWEEFDVRLYLTYYVKRGVRTEERSVQKPLYRQLYRHPVVELCNDTSGRLAELERCGLDRIVIYTIYRHE